MPRKIKPVLSSALPETVRVILKRNKILEENVLTWRLTDETLWVVTKNGKKLALAVNDEPA